MKRFFRTLAAATFALLPLTAQGSLVETFDDVGGLQAGGWAIVNNSSPVGPASWFQGDLFPAHEGAANSYIAANSDSVSGAGTISNWLITPEDTFNNGDVVSFWTSTVVQSFFADRLQVRLSTSGASTDVGTLATDVGDFTTLLLDINPTYVPEEYPEPWAEYEITLSGLAGPTSGRLAFRYFVEDGGPDGSRSAYIGIDTFSLVSVPEPSSALLLVGLATSGCLFRRRR